MSLAWDTASGVSRASVFQPIALGCAKCYNPGNDYDGDDVGRSQLSESRRWLRGGSRARAQSPPESRGKPAENKEQRTENKSFLMDCSSRRTNQRRLRPLY